MIKWCLKILIMLLGISCTEKEIKKDKEYYENGVLRKEIPRNKDGLIHGRLISYYQNGDTMLYTGWELGKKHGLEKSFYRNGNTQYILEYEKDKINGQMLGFYESGNIFQKAYYRDGILSGEFVEYFDSKNHEVSTINNYVNYQGSQKLTGWVNYFQDGSIESEESRIVVELQKDTLLLGENLIFNLSLTSPRYDSTYFFIGSYDGRFFGGDLPVVDTIYSTNHKIRYELKALKKGKNYIRGGAKNYAVLSPSKEGNRREIRRPEVYFERFYFVK
jgi:hypothetical protein